MVPYADKNETQQKATPRRNVTLHPIPSLWGHTAGAAPNAADSKFLNDEISNFLAPQVGK